MKFLYWCSVSRTGGNLPERMPHPPLKDGTSNIQGKFQPDPRRIHEPNGACYDSLVIAIRANKLRFRKAILEVPDEVIRITA